MSPVDGHLWDTLYFKSTCDLSLQTNIVFSIVFSVRAAGTVDVKLARRAAAATQLATAAPSASTRTGRSTTTSADRPSRPSSSRPASSREGSPAQRPPLLSAPPPALRAAGPGVRRQRHLLLPLAHPPPAPPHPLPWTAHHANRLMLWGWRLRPVGSRAPPPVAP